MARDRARRLLDDCWRGVVDHFEEERLATPSRSDDLRVLSEHFLVMFRLRKNEKSETKEALEIYRREYLPKVNAFFTTGIRVCKNCGDLCAAGKKFCCDGCRSAYGMRGRQKIGTGRSAAEMASLRRKKEFEKCIEKWKKHKATCTRDRCQKCEDLIHEVSAREDFLDQESKRLEISVEEGQVLRARRGTGRTPKRGR